MTKCPNRPARAKTPGNMNWRTWRDSNPRHPVPKTGALSAELQVRAVRLYRIGFEGQAASNGKSVNGSDSNAANPARPRIACFTVAADTACP